MSFSGCLLFGLTLDRGMHAPCDALLLPTVAHNISKCPCKARHLGMDTVQVPWRNRVDSVAL